MRLTPSEPNNVLLFSKVEVLDGGYPAMSTKNVSSMISIKEDVLAKGIKNLLPVGILAQNDLFFQFDIIKHIHEVVGEL
jgi:hypothetical protein